MSDAIVQSTSFFGKLLQRWQDAYVAKRLRTFQVWESDYGRMAGWILEYQSSPIALLSDPWFEDTFWYSYQMEFRQNAHVTEAEFYSDDFWNVRIFEKGYRWRNCYFDGYDGGAFSGRPPTIPGSRIFVRALYMTDVPSPTNLEHWILQQRKKRGQRWVPPDPAWDAIGTH